VATFRRKHTADRADEDFVDTSAMANGAFYLHEPRLDLLHGYHLPDQHGPRSESFPYGRELHVLLRPQEAQIASVPSFTEPVVVKNCMFHPCISDSELTGEGLAHASLRHQLTILRTLSRFTNIVETYIRF
jgi:hypothetical protein